MKANSPSLRHASLAGSGPAAATAPLLRLLALVLLVLHAASCSHIADDERLIYVKPADVARRVLIEDFTGQRCINCPIATLEIEKLQEQYGPDNVIAVGIHSGPLGFKGSATLTGLATDLGDAYYSHWAISYQPSGMVNRTGKQDYLQWSAQVRELIQQQAAADIGISCSYDDATRTARAAITVLATSGHTEGKLQVWAVEDSIVAMQLRYNEVDKPTSGQLQDRNYVHNHVLRSAVNGTWGDDLSLAEGQTVGKDYTFTADSTWRPEKLWVVAFVYNDQGVVQAARQRVVATAD